MKKANNSDMPVGGLTQIQDFLPSPDQLISPDDTVKVMISLTRTSLEFFKREAKKNNIKYQRMIREVVDRYAKKFN